MIGVLCVVCGCVWCARCVAYVCGVLRVYVMCVCGEGWVFRILCIAYLERCM